MSHRSSRRASIAVFVCCLVSLAGCAVPLTRDSDVYKVKPKLILNQGEFRVVRTVQGRASCPYFLWLDLPDFIQSALNLVSTIIAGQWVKTKLLQPFGGSVRHESFRNSSGATVYQQNS